MTDDEKEAFHALTNEVRELRKQLANEDCRHAYIEQGSFWDGYYETCVKCGDKKYPVRY